MTATPRPWMAVPRFDAEEFHFTDIMQQDKEPFSVNVASVWATKDRETSEANAALIVRAVNSHDHLVAALERLCLVQEGVPMSGILASQYLDQARAALKLAKGEA